MHKRYLRLLISILLLTAVISCKGEKMEEPKVNYNALTDVAAEAWERLAQKKIYFAHQSVGFNIIDGIRDLMKNNPQIRLNIVETADPAALQDGIFAHSRVGKNTDPKSKIDEFVMFMGDGIAEKTDIALMKFCYVDVGSGTDVETVFNAYKEAMNKLKKEYPKVDFIHVTVPLTTSKTGFKIWVKKMLGKDVWEYEDNIKRNQYNELIRQEYQGKGRIFDFAGTESTFPDGSRCFFKNKGHRYYSLVPEYTDDGGHLNEKGRKKAAEQFILFILNVK